MIKIVQVIDGEIKETYSKSEILPEEDWFYISIIEDELTQNKPKV